MSFSASPSSALGATSSIQGYLATAAAVSGKRRTSRSTEDDLARGFDSAFTARMALSGWSALDGVSSRKSGHDHVGAGLDETSVGDTNLEPDTENDGIDNKSRPSSGVVSFGYFVPAGVTQRWEAGNGDWAINEVQAWAIRRIFDEYAAGESPSAIAYRLNHEGVPGPNGRLWSGKILLGKATRSDGILANELYHGEVVWNRCTYIRDIETDRRWEVRNPHDRWYRKGMESLRIVSEELWENVKSRLSTRHSRNVKSAKADVTDCPVDKQSNGTRSDPQPATGTNRRDEEVWAEMDAAEIRLRTPVVSRGAANEDSEPNLVARFERYRGSADPIQGMGPSSEHRRNTKRTPPKQRIDVLRECIMELENKIENILEAIENGIHSKILNTRLQIFVDEKEMIERDLMERP